MGPWTSPGGGRWGHRAFGRRGAEGSLQNGGVACDEGLRRCRRWARVRGVDPEGPGAVGPGVPAEALGSWQALQLVPKPFAWGMMVRVRRGWQGASRGVRRGPAPPELSLKAGPGQACSRSLGYLGPNRAPTVSVAIRAFHTCLTVPG